MQMAPASDIPVVILAGGYGSRLGEYSEKLPKPLIRIGNFPILIHIMKLWHNAGHREFIVLGGYKYRELTEELWANNWEDILPESHIAPVDTGIETETGGRLLKVRGLLNRKFCLSYGDGLTSYPLENLLYEHNKTNPICSMLVTHPISRFGEVQFGKDRVVRGFSEKPILDSWINSGFFVFEPEVFEYIQYETDVLEKHIFPRLVDVWSLCVVENHDWWHCMDTPKDVRVLNDLWKEGNAPWVK